MAVLDGDAFTPSARKFPDEVGNVRVEKPFDGQSPRIGEGVSCADPNTSVSCHVWPIHPCAGASTRRSTQSAVIAEPREGATARKHDDGLSLATRVHVTRRAVVPRGADTLAESSRGTRCVVGGTNASAR